MKKWFNKHHMKKWVIVVLLAFFGSGVSVAKVTYDEAIKQDEKIISSNPHLPRAHGLTSAELSQQTTTADNRTWHNLTHARASGQVYQNTTPNQIIVAVTPVGERWEEMRSYVNGVQFGRIYSGDFGGGATITMPVPAGATYQVNVWNHRGQVSGITNWLELR
ncbi:TPA: hypothetical protein ACGGSC_003206 [Vibrio cholerae]